jgi:hypothetical protein
MGFWPLRNAIRLHVSNVHVARAARAVGVSPERRRGLPIRLFGSMRGLGLIPLQMSTFGIPHKVAEITLQPAKKRITRDEAHQHVYDTLAFRASEAHEAGEKELWKAYIEAMAAAGKEWSQ